MSYSEGEKMVAELDLLRRERIAFIKETEKLKEQLQLALGNAACYKAKWEKMVRAEEIAQADAISESPILKKRGRPKRPKGAHRIKPKKAEPKVKKVRLPVDAFSLARIRAAERVIQWELTEDDYYQLISLPCHYCTGPLARSGVRLDRVDSKGHYHLNNVVPCCYRCNMVKNKHLNLKQMEAVGKVLQQLDAQG